MAGNIAAAEGAILRGADTVAGTRQDLDFRIKTIEGQMIAMGAVSFQQLMTAWNEDARKVTNALVQLEDSLRRTQQEYDTTDEDQNLTFTKVTQRLGGIR